MKRRTAPRRQNRPLGYNRPLGFLGIDLGACTSAAACIEHGGPALIPGADGSCLVPSVVYFGGHRDRRVLVGHAAVRRPDEAVRLVKDGLDDGPDTTTMGLMHTFSDVAAILLEELKRNAEAHLGRTVANAVLAVPNWFGIVERCALLATGGTD